MSAFVLLLITCLFIPHSIPADFSIPDVDSTNLNQFLAKYWDDLCQMDTISRLKDMLISFLRLPLRIYQLRRIEKYIITDYCCLPSEANDYRSNMFIFNCPRGYPYSHEYGTVNTTDEEYDDLGRLVEHTNMNAFMKALGAINGSFLIETTLNDNVGEFEPLIDIMNMDNYTEKMLEMRRVYGFHPIGLLQKFIFLSFDAFGMPWKNDIIPPPKKSKTKPIPKKH